MIEIVNKPKKIVELFITFLKIGAFTFGGGYAMISLIQSEISENKGWISSDDILDVVAIAESTPGPIAINAATFVGYKVCGVLGAFCATLGVILPSFAIITVISFFLDKFESFKPVRYAFGGIRVGVLVLILKALVSMYTKYKKDLFAYIIMAFSFIGTAFFSFNVLAVLALCAAAGLLNVYYITLRRSGK